LPRGHRGIEAFGDRDHVARWCFVGITAVVSRVVFVPRRHQLKVGYFLGPEPD
jgi:hypothetical protein